MKKAIKTITILLTFLVGIPAAAGLALTVLWNNILTAACGFSTIGIWQGIGIFLTGQILSGGFVIGLLITGASLHKVFHHHGEWHTHWHAMTDEQRREFIERRRRYPGFGNHAKEGHNAAE